MRSCRLTYVRALALVLVLGCACRDRTPSSSDDDASVPGPDATVADCSGAPDLTACTGADASTGICVASRCEPLAPCAGGCAQTGPRFRLPDTNLRVCFGPSPDGTDGTIACPGTPGGADCATTDYCGEDAQYGWDAPHAAGARFTVTTPGG